tara:strand:- start:20399 stop:20605 length:207 start_codon:yes stop_codon:yes gene_type:complete
MRYANSKKSHIGIGVHPRKHTDTIVMDGDHDVVISIKDVGQLVSLTRLLLEAGREMGWPVNATARKGS